jgi:hypothetical protein
MNGNARAIAVMRIALPFIGGLLAFLALLAIANCSDAAERECLHSAAAVRAAYGQSAWPSWSDHVKGHRGRCYFPSERKGRVRIAKLEQPAVQVAVEAPAAPIEAAVPVRAEPRWIDAFDLVATPKASLALQVWVAQRAQELRVGR